VFTEMLVKVIVVIVAGTFSVNTQSMTAVRKFMLCWESTSYCGGRQFL